MKSNIYYLIENGKTLHRSDSLEKLINFTAKTKDAKSIITMFLYGYRILNGI